MCTCKFYHVSYRNVIFRLHTFTASSSLICKIIHKYQRASFTIIDLSRNIGIIRSFYASAIISIHGYHIRGYSFLFGILLEAAAHLRADPLAMIALAHTSMLHKRCTSRWPWITHGGAVVRVVDEGGEERNSEERSDRNERMNRVAAREGRKSCRGDERGMKREMHPKRILRRDEQN